MTNQGDILIEILEHLKSLYESSIIKPGKLLRVGLKSGWNVVIGSDGQCGMAMNFSGDEQAFGKYRIDSKRLQSFIDRDLMETASYYISSESWQERSIGVAIMSALSQPFLEPTVLAGRDITILENRSGFTGFIKPDDIAAVVGYGGGVPNLIGKCRELHVTDMRSREAFQTVLIDKEIEYYPKGVYVHPMNENKEVLSDASVVFITGSSLVNGTFSELISYTKKARLVTVYGASTSLVPDVLFRYGVHAVQSYRLVDPDAFEDGMLNERSMEPVMKGTQKSQTMCSPNMSL